MCDKSWQESKFEMCTGLLSKSVFFLPCVLVINFEPASAGSTWTPFSMLSHWMRPYPFHTELIYCFTWKIAKSVCNNSIDWSHQVQTVKILKIWNPLFLFHRRYLKVSWNNPTYSFLLALPWWGPLHLFQNIVYFTQDCPSDLSERLQWPYFQVAEAAPLVSSLRTEIYH